MCREVFLVVAIVLDGSVAGICNQFLQTCELLLGQISVGTGLQTAELDVHDPDPLKGSDPVFKSFTHPADLAVQTLCKDNAKGELIDLFDEAGACHGVEDGYT